MQTEQPVHVQAALLQDGRQKKDNKIGYQEVARDGRNISHNDCKSTAFSSNTRTKSAPIKEKCTFFA